MRLARLTALALALLAAPLAAELREAGKVYRIALLHHNAAVANMTEANLKTAKALGLPIPPAVLARADEVIQ